MTAGTILALILDSAIKMDDFDFSQEILAVVGGYSADAVSTILERIAELIVAIFKGTEKADAHEVENKIKQAKDIEKANGKLNFLSVLTDLKSKASQLNDPKKIIDEIDKNLNQI